MPIITLLTDFGTQDHYVAAMKGVVLGICPDATVVDITHNVTPGNIRQAAYLLHQASREFPRETVHVSVVDPGVGSERRIVAVETNAGRFVAPDNGLLSLAVGQVSTPIVRSVENEAWFRHPVSTTFHGRDIMAPTAARWAAGWDIADVGPIVSELARMHWPRTETDGEGLVGEVIHIDRFGNLVTNISAKQIPDNDVTFEVAGRRILGLVRNFIAAPADAPAAIIGSAGFVEIVVNMDSAARLLGADVGTKIMCHPEEA